MNNQNKPPFIYRLQAFMYGRNGMDRFNRFLIVVYIICMFVNIFVRSVVFSIIQLLLLAYIVFRFLSKNIYARQQEDAIYFGISKSVRDFFILTKNRIKDRKNHVYKKCPSCKSVLRLPKRKGNHTVRCPRCQNRFDVKI